MRRRFTVQLCNIKNMAIFCLHNLRSSHSLFCDFGEMFEESLQIIIYKCNTSSEAGVSLSLSVSSSY